MSRTTRKRIYSYESYWRNWPEELVDPVNRARYYSKSDKWMSHKLPKFFRNSVNRSRRRHDVREIFKAVNIEGYEEQCSKWNCKDNNSWGYW